MDFILNLLEDVLEKDIVKDLLRIMTVIGILGFLHLILRRFYSNALHLIPWLYKEIVLWFFCVVLPRIVAYIINSLGFLKNNFLENYKNERKKFLNRYVKREMAIECKVLLAEEITQRLIDQWFKTLPIETQREHLARNTEGTEGIEGTEGTEEMHEEGR